MPPDAQAPLTPGRWTVEPGRSTVGFAVRHLMVTTVRGGFDRFEASLDIDRSGRMHALGSVDSASISTGEPKRDASLRHQGFLDTERYPDIFFTSREIRQTDGGLRIVGDLTLKGITRPIALTGSVVGESTGSPDEERARIVARGTISRADFGVTGGGVLESAGALVSDKVDVAVDVSAVRLPESRR